MNLVEMIGKFTMPLSVKPSFLGYLVMSRESSFVCSGVCAHAFLVSQVYPYCVVRACMRTPHACRGSSLEQTPYRTFRIRMVSLSSESAHAP